jgi:glycosyltransferase involved in cell wall biosynthesis
MKIIHILLGKANPNTLNGVNKVVDALATEQTLLGHDVTVCGVASNLEQRHNPIYNYSLFIASKNPFKFSTKLWNELLQITDKETIFHFHSVFIPWFLPLMKRLRKNGFHKIVLTPHGGYLKATVNKSLKKRLFFRFYDSKIIKNSSMIHIIGKNTELCDLIRPYINQYKIVPNGCYPTNNNPKFNHSDLIFGYMGRLQIDHKGLDLLFKAFHQYKQQGGSGMLYLAGNGPDEKKLKDFCIKNNINNSVEFLGVLFNEKKAEFLNNCSIFVHTSRWDVIPTSVLEASEYGVPLLITKETNLDEYVNDYYAGLIISPNTVENITLKLKEFESIYVNDPTVYHQMCINSRLLIEKELNWTNITKKIIEELYHF